MSEALTGLVIAMVGLCTGYALADLWWWIPRQRDCECLDPDCHHYHPDTDRSDDQ